MAKRITGIEIGNHHVTMMQCENGKVLKAIIEPLPENYVVDNCITSMAVMGDFLKQMAKKDGFRDKNCALILPGSVAFIRRLTMPAMTKRQLKLNLPYEFHDFINESSDNYIFDYAVLDLIRDEETDKPVSMDLLTAAVPEQHMENLKQMMKQAGFRLMIAAPEESAFSNIIRSYETRHNILEKNEYCFIDIGYTKTKMHIYTGSRFEVSREIEYGCGNLVNAISAVKNVDIHNARIQLQDNYENVWDMEACHDVYDTIAVEIMRAVNFYQFNNPNSDLKDVYFCGGGSMIEPLVERVMRGIPLKRQTMASLIEHLEGAEDAVIIGPAAAGITII